MARCRMLNVPGYEPGQAGRRSCVRRLLESELQRATGKSDRTHVAHEPGNGGGRGDYRRRHRRARAGRTSSRGGAVMATAKIQTIEGRALPIRGEDMDTDRIMPARFLKGITFDPPRQHVFAGERTAAGAPGR